MRFYDCDGLWIRRNRYFDSAPVAPDASDHFSFVTTKNVTNNTNVHICGNRIEDLQLEVDHCSGATVCHNKVYRSPVTAGIGVFSTATGSPVCEDYDIHDNLIVDPKASAAAITVDVDPAGADNVTMRRFNIHDNNVVYTGATPPKRGVLVGTTNNNTVSSGCAFSDIDVFHNRITYAGGAFSGEAIFFNSSATTTITFERCDVSQNRLSGTGGGTGIDLRRFDNGSVVDNRVTNFETPVSVGTAVTPSFVRLIG